MRPKHPPVCTAQAFLIQDLDDLGDDVQWRQGTDALDHLIVCAWRPSTDSDSFDLSGADRPGTPGHADLDLALVTDPIELDLGDEITQQLLAFLHAGAGGMPDSGQVLRQAPDVALLFGAEREVLLGLGRLVGLLQVMHGLELLVLTPLQGGGHQAIVRVDGIVLALGKLRLVAGLAELLFPLLLQGLFFLDQVVDDL